jgi:hypothetical protein
VRRFQSRGRSLSSKIETGRKYVSDRLGDEFENFFSKFLSEQGNAATWLVAQQVE